ncbi:MAG: DUF4412 domain-containing protein [Bacteroidales bacterium]
MKKIVLLLSMLVFVIPFGEIQAQSLRSLMRKKLIEKALEEDAEKDSVKAVEEGREPEKSPNRTMNDVYLDAMGLKGNVEYESSYDYDAYIQMEVSSFDDDGKPEDKLAYDSYFNKGSENYALVSSDKGDKSIFLFDSENNSMLILMDSDGEKSGFAMYVDEESFEDSEEPDEVTNYAQHKTGRTKNILGYSCEEYLMEDEDSEVHMWVSEKLGKEVRKEMLMNQRAFGTSFHHASDLDGMVMEYDYTDKEDEERVVMQVTGIDMDHSHAISTYGYSMISMPPEDEEAGEEETEEE